MRTESRPRTAGNDMQVWRVTWTMPNGKRTSGCCTQSRDKAVATYQRKEAAGKMPVLVEDWIGGWAF